MVSAAVFCCLCGFERNLTSYIYIYNQKRVFTRITRNARRENMKITIECEKCKKTHSFSSLPRKYLQLRDNLEKGGFRYNASDTKIRDGKLEEFMIHCGCGNYISLGMD